MHPKPYSIYLRGTITWAVVLRRSLGDDGSVFRVLKIGTDGLG